MIWTPESLRATALATAGDDKSNWTLEDEHSEWHDERPDYDLCVYCREERAERGEP
jgi:hypothetical protein